MSMKNMRTMMTNPLTARTKRNTNVHDTNMHNPNVHQASRVVAPEVAKRLTKRSGNRSTTSMAFIHFSLITSSIAATLLGANLLAGADASATALPTNEFNDRTSTLVDAATDIQTVAVAPSSVGALILAPVPTLHAPTIIRDGSANLLASGTVAGGNGENGAPADSPLFQLQIEDIPQVAVPNIAAAVPVLEGSSTDLSTILSNELPAIPDVQSTIAQAAAQQAAAQQASQQSQQRSAPVSRSRSSR